jgi:hypothetical protein
VDRRFSGQPGSNSLSRNIGLSAITSLLIAVMPKCPICWMALMSAIGAGSAISVSWLQPAAVAMLFVSVSALFVRARSRRGYGPFILGFVAAGSLYLFKFSLNYDPGVYLSGATLLGASIWNTREKRQPAGNVHCDC